MRDISHSHHPGQEYFLVASFFPRNVKRTNRSGKWLHTAANNQVALGRDMKSLFKDYIWLPRPWAQQKPQLWDLLGNYGKLLSSAMHLIQGSQIWVKVCLWRFSCFVYDFYLCVLPWTECVAKAVLRHFPSWIYFYSLLWKVWEYREAWYPLSGVLKTRQWLRLGHIGHIDTV